MPSQPSWTTSSSSPSNLCLPHQNIKGKDLFDATLWKDPLSTSIFYKFISSLRKKIREEVKAASPTHRFTKTLRDTHKLVRCYTQNIDGLEAREGLCSNMSRGTGSRARFTKKVLEKPRSDAPIMPGSDRDGGCEVVQLHGELEDLRCTLCQKTCSWEDGREVTLLGGEAPECQACLDADRDRRNRGKRGTAVGRLRPNIVLYGEEHPSADLLSKITTHDLGLAPDVLLILGTSLRVHGLKILVKEFAKAVHAKAGGKGKVIFVNLTKPPESVWNGVIDYHVAMDCDAWVGDLRTRRPDIWQQQAQLQLQITKNPNAKQPKRIFSKMKPNFASEEDKENTRSIDTSFDREAPKVEVHTIKPQLKDRKRIIASAETPRKRMKQLLTPPSSGRQPLYDDQSSTRSLFGPYENSQPPTPSKRRKTNIAVWEDADSGPGHEIPDSEEDELSYDEECIVMSSPGTSISVPSLIGRQITMGTVEAARKRQRA